MDSAQVQTIGLKEARMGGVSLKLVFVLLDWHPHPSVFAILCSVCSLLDVKNEREGEPERARASDRAACRTYSV